MTPQGQLIEMDDPEYGGNGFFGRLMGTVISCHCGCGATMSGAHQTRPGSSEI